LFVQVVIFSLEGISEEGYLDVANNLAPRFAGLPGLLAKVWLENPGANRYGAVYFWEDAESMERFGDSDLFEGETPEFADFISEEFRVLDNLTAQTQPVLEILEPRRGGVEAQPAAALKATSEAAPAARVNKASPTLLGKAAATGPAKKATAKKSTVKGTTVKAPAKKAAVKKATVKKATVKKAPVKATGKKAAVKAPAKKAGRKAAR
jgi:heme-degrading monooxygenase HmoA